MFYEIASAGSKSETASTGHAGAAQVCGKRAKPMCSTLTILLVEDDAKDVTLAEFALKRILPGIQINIVTDGLKAVNYLAGDWPYADRSKYPMPDVVLLDLQLPLLHGFDVVRWIR